MTARAETQNAVAGEAVASLTQPSEKQKEDELYRQKNNFICAYNNYDAYMEVPFDLSMFLLTGCFGFNLICLLYAVFAYYKN